MRILYQFVVLALLLSFVVHLLSQNKRRRKNGGAPCTYRRNPGLFSLAEKSFFMALEQVFGPAYKVLGKVRIADLITPLNGAGQRCALDQIIGKHVDFVVCDSKDLSIIGVIELDDLIYFGDSGQQRDAFIDSAFSSAGIPIVRFSAQADYNISSVRDIVRQSFRLNLEEPKTPPPNPPVLKPEIAAKVLSMCEFRKRNLLEAK